MKRLSLGLIAFLGLYSSASLGSDPVDQVYISSHAEKDQACELQGGEEPPFTIDQHKEKTRSGCTVSIPKELFFQRYDYCALSGMNEYNDDTLDREHDYGSQCSFTVDDASVSFKATRGFGFKEGSTSALYCIFSCVKPDSVSSPGDDLEAIISKPLAN